MRLITLILPATLAAGVALAQTPPRLDGGVFAALSGDPAIMKAALDDTAAALARNPEDAVAMVEHGFLTVFAGSARLRVGDQSAMQEVNTGMAEVDRAVATAPDNGRVRALRGILMQQAAYDAPAAAGRPMLEKALTDFRRLYDLQAGDLKGLGEHRLGELLQIRADVESRLSLTEDAERTYAQIQALLPGTEYASRAAAWMTTRAPLPRNQTTCIGCHVTP